MVDPYDIWIWDELLAFDVMQSDFGVNRYIDTLGFIPNVISIFPLFPAFIHEHIGIDNSKLDNRFCSMYGRRGGQSWSKAQLRDLVDELHAKDIKVFLTFFSFTRGGFGGEHGLVDEWIELKHPELLTVDNTGKKIHAINMLKKTKEGTPYVNFLSEKLTETMKDYGFDGFNGGDGWSGLRGQISSVDFSNEMIQEFERTRKITIPRNIDENKKNVMGEREDIALWIWKNLRGEWTKFYSDQWTNFWKKLSKDLHLIGRKCVTHDAWWRSPADALYNYGFDYRRIAEAGVDAMIVQTVSCDLNYRSRLWKWGKSPNEVMSELVSYVDMVIGNEEDVQSIFGIESSEIDVEKGEVAAENYYIIANEIMKRFTNIDKVAITLRGSISASHNTWSGILYDGKILYKAPIYDLTHIVDRIGGGDSFSGSIIYKMINSKDDLQGALDFAVAASCLKHSIPGDHLILKLEEVEKLLKGIVSGRVSR